MQPKVLVAIDFRAPTPWAAGYAVKLAARLKFPLVFLGVAAVAGPEPALGGGLLPQDLDEVHRRRLEGVVQQCQEEGVGLEIFFAAGPFFQQVSQLLDSAGNYQFLVVGVPQGAPPKEMEDFSRSLKDLRQRFRGEILLVREQGKIAQLTDLEAHLQRRKP